jgi:hypothetical protein
MMLQIVSQKVYFCIRKMILYICSYFGYPEVLKWQIR